jgi:hypothetical protein
MTLAVHKLVITLVTNTWSLAALDLFVCAHSPGLGCMHTLIPITHTYVNPLTRSTNDTTDRPTDKGMPLELDPGARSFDLMPTSLFVSYHGVITLVYDGWPDGAMGVKVCCGQPCSPAFDNHAAFWPTKWLPSQVAGQEK